MQQQYQLTFTMPLAPPPKNPQGDLTLPDDLASLQTVWSSRTLHAAWRCQPEPAQWCCQPADCMVAMHSAYSVQHCLSIIACHGRVTLHSVRTVECESELGTLQGEA